MTRHIYVFTLISYVLLFATLIAVGGVFLYKNLVDTQLEQSIIALSSEISSFSVADMERVQSFEHRLRQAEDRLENSVSNLSILRAIEEATIDLVQFESFDMERVGDERYNLDASVVTNSFDSAIFQRGVFRRNQIVEGIAISDLTTVDVQADDQGSPIDQPSSDFSLISFTASLEVPISQVPYTAPDPDTLEVIDEAVLEIATSTMIDDGTVADGEVEDSFNETGI
jgi:hypothetical protein